MKRITIIAATDGKPPKADIPRLTRFTGNESEVISEVKWTASRAPVPVSAEKKSALKKCPHFINEMNIATAETASINIKNIIKRTLILSPLNCMIDERALLLNFLLSVFQPILQPFS